MEQADFKTKLCEEAHTIFLEESHSGYYKYKYLPHWLKSKSLYLSRERTESQQPISHKIYLRGTIIFVDFGINVGNELSGNHFAIVLNNSDNRKNGVLTVIPISSKNKKCYIPLEHLIPQQSIQHMTKSSANIRSELGALVVFLVKDGQIPYPKLTDNLKKIYNIANKLSLSEAKNILIDCNHDFSNITGILTILDRLAFDSDLYKKVFDKYQKYSENSFAMPLSIQSISKKRIRRINKFDPSGEIKAPPKVMEKLDSAILNLFTHNKSK